MVKFGPGSTFSTSAVLKCYKDWFCRFRRTFFFTPWCGWVGWKKWLKSNLSRHIRRDWQHQEVEVAYWVPSGSCPSEFEITYAKCSWKMSVSLNQTGWITHCRKKHSSWKKGNCDFIVSQESIKSSIQFNQNFDSYSQRSNVSTLKCFYAVIQFKIKNSSSTSFVYLFTCLLTYFLVLGRN